MLWGLSAAVLMAGCEPQDNYPDWDPAADYPSWAFDAPFYYRPAREPAVVETVATGVPVYYPARRQFFVKHPTGRQPGGVPRVAVWCSLDRGQRWRRAGCFGVGQTHFLFQAVDDGPHWIRFLGPSQPPAADDPGAPQRVYVVDTDPPDVDFALAAPDRPDGAAAPRRVLAVGEEVRLRWRIRDENLDPARTRLASNFALRPERAVWTPFPVTPPADGEMVVPVPTEALDPGGGRMRFRLEARDKAGNMRLAFSEPLEVAGEVRRRAAGPRPPAPRGAAAERPGWPGPGECLRGGTSRRLSWLPSSAARYEQVVLEFSASNGRGWRMVAEGIRSGRDNVWWVPPVNAGLCRLRVVALAPGARRVLLAGSLPFAVRTGPPGARAAAVGPHR